MFWKTLFKHNNKRYIKNGGDAYEDSLQMHEVRPNYNYSRLFLSKILTLADWFFNCEANCAA